MLLCATQLFHKYLLLLSKIGAHPMTPELETVLRKVIHVLYAQSEEEGDESYWCLADELSAIITELREDDDPTLD